MLRCAARQVRYPGPDPGDCPQSFPRRLFAQPDGVPMGNAEQLHAAFRPAQGQVLIERNALDRTLYLIETGGLTVHYEDDKGRVRLALVGPGSAVGEGAFFTRPAQRHGAGGLAQQDLVPDADPLHRTQQPPSRGGARGRHGAGLAGGAPPGQQAQAHRGHLRRNYSRTPGFEAPVGRALPRDGRWRPCGPHYTAGVARTKSYAPIPA